MRKFLLLAVMACIFTVSQAQKLTLDRLDELLNSSMDEAEESLFLVGYTFFLKEALADSAGMIYKFTNRKNTIGTAKAVFKGVYSKEITSSFIKYITYDRVEFENFRRAMIEHQFIRSISDDISENSNYIKENLKVNFEVTTDEYENKMFVITLRNYKTDPIARRPEKTGLRNIFKQ